MRDLGVIFSAPMVTALRDCRKTQTRRLRTSPLSRLERNDRLWVRESFRFFSGPSDDAEIHYADDRVTQVGPCSGDIPDPALVGYFRFVDRSQKKGAAVSIPAIHMPRWASRLTLLVTDVRFERLQAISEADARAEGVGKPYFGDGDEPFVEPGVMVSSGMQYRNLWKTLHQKEGQRWDDNPEVVAVSFRVFICNIDKLKE